jgi:competence protein ComEA
MTARRSTRIRILLCLAGAAFLASATGVFAQESKAKAKVDAKKASKLIDLNAATSEELQQLPGVGEVTAKKIIDGRPYKTVDDLAKAGVSANEIEKIRPLVTAREPAKRAPAPSSERPPANTAGPVDVNSASVQELEALPGVGPVIAEAIVKERPFKSLADLERVKGLGKAKVADLKGRVKFGTAESASAEKTQQAPAAKAKAPKSTSRPPSATPGNKVNINTASKEELDALPGIGPVRAQEIIEGRPFKNIEDIKKLKGIKDFEFNKIKDMITVK